MLNVLKLVCAIILFSACNSGEELPVLETVIYYPDNEEGLYQDMLTPQYYLSESENVFRTEMNKFIHFAQLEAFHHPLATSSGLPNYTVKREFGVEIGQGTGTQHHPAIDLHIENKETNVGIYAAHDGVVAIYLEASKYRDYLTVTKNIEDSTGVILGKIVSIYAHIDLILDATDNIIVDNKNVKKGDLVSKNLYSETAGGAHLHFEVRYYRNTDTGFEEFYGGQDNSYTDISKGIWTEGYWNPQVGYGFGNPKSHGISL